MSPSSLWNRHALIWLPIGALLGSYLWLVVDHGTLRLWNVTVHESGQYTLGETVLYVRHFVREVPVGVGYALFLVAAAAGAGWLSKSDQPHRRLTASWTVVATAFAGALLLIASAAAIREQGLASTLLDLGQYRTRDDLVSYGSHWRFHWLSSAWFGLAALWLAPRLGGPARATGNAWSARPWIRLAWGFFAMLTLIFGVGPEIVTDVRYTGHQAREIVTHGLITAMLGLGLLRFVLADADRPIAADPGVGGRPSTSTKAHGVLFALIPAYLGLVTLVGDPMSAGQSSQGLAAMVAGHTFEHVLDYLFVLLLSLAGCGWIVSRAAHG